MLQRESLLLVDFFFMRLGMLVLGPNMRMKTIWKTHIFEAEDARDDRFKNVEYRKQRMTLRLFKKFRNIW